MSSYRRLKMRLGRPRRVVNDVWDDPPVVPDVPAASHQTKVAVPYPCTVAGEGGRRCEHLMPDPTPRCTACPCTHALADVAARLRDCPEGRWRHKT